MCTHIVQCMLAHFRLEALSLIPRPLPVYVNGAEFALLTYDRCPDLHAGHIAPMLWSELYGSELYG